MQEGETKRTRKEHGMGNMEIVSQFLRGALMFYSFQFAVY